MTNHHLFLNWQETDPKKPLAQVLIEAVAHYTRKYGQPPVLARVPLAFPDLNGTAPEGLTIERHKDVKPGYLWLQTPDRQPQVDPDTASPQAETEEDHEG